MAVLGTLLVIVPGALGASTTLQMIGFLLTSGVAAAVAARVAGPPE